MQQRASLPKRVAESRFAREVLTLLSGNGLAQLVSLTAAPLLARIYAPDAFGVFALFVAIVAVLTPGVGGRYEAAVVVASASERRDLFFIAVWFMASLCLLCWVALMVAFGPVSALLNAGALGDWLWLTPLALFATGVIVAMRSWANAIKDYRQMSYAAVVQTASVSLLAIGIGVVGNVNGLLYANVVGSLLTCVYLTYIFRDLLRDNHWRWDRRKWELAWRHKDFPLFNAPTNILNGLMTSLPVFFLARHFPEAVLGHYALMARVGVAPLSFVAAAVSDVNVKRVSELLQTGQDPMPYLRRISLLLLAVAVPPAASLVSSAPQLFSLVFGEQWRQSGVMLSILMPAIAVQFVVSPLSMSLLAAGRMRLLSAWQVLALLVTVAVLAWSGRSGDIEGLLWALMIKDVALYGLYYAMIVFALRHPVQVCTCAQHVDANDGPLRP